MKSRTWSRVLFGFYFFTTLPPSPSPLPERVDRLSKRPNDDDSNNYRRNAGSQYGTERVYERDMYHMLLYYEFTRSGAFARRERFYSASVSINRDNNYSGKSLRPRGQRTPPVCVVMKRDDGLGRDARFAVDTRSRIESIANSDGKRDGKKKTQTTEKWANKKLHRLRVGMIIKTGENTRSEFIFYVPFSTSRQYYLTRFLDSSIQCFIAMNCFETK